MKAKKAVRKTRKSPASAPKPVVKVIALEPDIVAIHVRAEPEHVAELLPHTGDPKTLFQKLADWFNDK